MSSSPTPAAASCGCAAPTFDGRSAAYKRALVAVIAINAIGFVVVAMGSWLARSTALAANTLDFVGDAATYALSLWVIGRSVQTRSNAALFKGLTLAAMALATLALAGWRAFSGAAPEGLEISGFGLFGTAANLLAAVLLVRFRDGDANVRSVWLCTRNDLIQCLAVAGTGVAVSVLHASWPDLLVGVGLALLFLVSAWQIISQARQEVGAADGALRQDRAGG